MSPSISVGRIAAQVGDFSRSPAYLGLAEALREVIGDGRVGYGVRLPSERELTTTLGVSRTTVTRAYAELREQGYAEARHGSGTYTRLPGGRARALDRALTPSTPGDQGLDMVCAAATAPPGIAAAYAEAATELPAYLGGHGYYPAGLPALQAAIARRYDDRGLPTAPDQVIVTAGALAATAIVGRALARPGDRVLIDSPTYPNAAQALQTGGGRLVAHPIDADGWDLDGIAGVLSRRRPALAHLMPDLHNPTGLVMPAGQRRRLASLLRAHGCRAVVDEAHESLLFEGEPLPPFASYSGDALTLGSASKSLWGGLRLGWIRAPYDLVDRLTQARIALDLGAPVLEQLVLLKLLDPEFAPVAQAHRDRLRMQRDALAAAVAEQLPEWRFRLPPGGMVLWCELPAARSTALVDAAHDLGVHLAPGPSFAPEGGLDRFLRLTYTLPIPDLQDAVRRIASAWRALDSDLPPTPSTRARPSPTPVLVA